MYRLLKAHDLITSPASIAIKAASEFKDKTTAPNQLWQTDFTYLKITGWGWRVTDAIKKLKAMRKGTRLDGLSWKDLRDEGRR